ncbi:MAG: SpoIIE family protein phosphatase, partial [Bacteroidetes bacterium]|nr:SpoIIE family protein phosphatase [Bacteroidota bacterium]
AYFTPIILIALLPIAFGYSIFRYSLMDVSEVVKNTVVYGVATITLAALYFLLIYVIGQSVSSAIGTEYQGIIFGAVFVLFAVVFQSTKDKFQDFLTAKFYPEQFSYQKGLLEFNGAIASVVGKQNIFDAIQKLFVQVLQIETFGLLLKSKSGVFELVRYQGISNNRLNLHNDKPVIENYCLECMMLGKKQVIERQDFEEILGSSAYKFLAEKIYTIIPLFINSKLIGLLLIGLKHSGSQFTGKDLDLLISASLQTAISIENARLYESEAEKQKIQRDLENARHIQETLLPKVVPQINNLDISGKMIPAMHVGGDYFDLIKISDTKLFVVVGDVSGKGLSASFYMSKLQTMIRLYCIDGKSPREILVEVNSRISESIEKNWFITVTLGLFDVEEKSLTVCRAGHTSIVRVRNGKLETLQPAGMGVGLDRGEVFSNSLEEAVYKLQNNDLYFFYSDGVTELMNENDELFGEERLGKSLLMNASKSCNDIEAGLMKDLSDFRGKTPQYDDVTTLLVRHI